MLVGLLLWGGTVGAAVPAKAAPQGPCRAAARPGSRGGLEAEGDAHGRLRGGPAPPADHPLILGAGNGELDVAGRLVGEAGGDWNAAVIDYGSMEFVT